MRKDKISSKEDYTQEEMNYIVEVEDREKELEQNLKDL